MDGGGRDFPRDDKEEEEEKEEEEGGASSEGGDGAPGVSSARVLPQHGASSAQAALPPEPGRQPAGAPEPGGGGPAGVLPRLPNLTPSVL